MMTILGKGMPTQNGQLSITQGRQARRTQHPLLCPQLTREFFTKELTKHYQGDNDTDVFSATWNSVMITVSALPHVFPGYHEHPKP